MTVSISTLKLAKTQKIPVLVFIHAGALSIGSGERQYYNPVSLCTESLNASEPITFASINYRLGALRILHSPKASGILTMASTTKYELSNGSIVS